MIFLDHRFHLIFLLACLGTMVGVGTTRAQIYVAYSNTGVISEYDEATGAVISDLFILGLKEPHQLALFNGQLYVSQANGKIGIYNSRTGATIRDDLVSGLNMPQAMTVAGGAIYVGDMDWQTHYPKIEKYNAYNGALISANLVTFAPKMENGMSFGSPIPTGFAVSGNRLFVAGVGVHSAINVYDATTGSLINDKFFFPGLSAYGLFASGHWLYFCTNSPWGGAIFRVDPETGKAPYDIQGFPRAMNSKVDNPKMLALSGDDLIVGQGRGTAIGKYNAVTGDVINAKFITSLHDVLGGLAAVSRDETPEETAVDSKFEWHKTLFDYGMALMANENYYLLGGCGVVALIALIMLAFAIRPKPPAPIAPEPLVEEPVAETPAMEEPPMEFPAPKAPAVEAAPVAEEPATRAVETPEIPTEPRGIPGLALVAIVLFLATLGTAAYLGYALLAPTGTDLSPYGDRARDIIGIWRYENDAREADERPVMLTVEVYPHEINFSEGNGPHLKPGRWHDNAFWIDNADGSGETQVAHLTDPLDMEVEANAFIPTRTDKPVLYKVMGSAAEKEAIAAKYPGAHTFPPRKGVDHLLYERVRSHRPALARRFPHGNRRVLFPRHHLPLP